MLLRTRALITAYAAIAIPFRPLPTNALHVAFLPRLLHPFPTLVFFSSSPMHFLYIQPPFLIPLPLLLRPSFACCPPSVCPILFLFIFLSFLLLTLASPSTSIRKPYRVRAMTDHPTPTVEGIYWRSIYVTRSFKYPRRSWQHAVP